MGRTGKQAGRREEKWAGMGRKREKRGEKGRQREKWGERRKEGGRRGKGIGTQPEGTSSKRRAFDSMSHHLVDNVARSSEPRVCAPATGGAHVRRGCSRPAENNASTTELLKATLAPRTASAGADPAPPCRNPSSAGASRACKMVFAVTDSSTGRH